MTKKDKTPPSAEKIVSVNEYEFVERDESEEKQEDINYSRLLNISVEQRSLEDEEEESQQVVFYCKECEKINPTEKVKGKKLKFRCAECKSDRIYLGTKLGIEKYFHLSS